MLRFVIPTPTTDNVACPNCRTVHRNVQFHSQDGRDIACQCGAAMAFVPNGFPEFFSDSGSNP